MVKKCWTEGGDKGVNNNSTDLESTNEKLLGKYKKTHQNKYVDCANKKLNQ